MKFSTRQFTHSTGVGKPVFTDITYSDNIFTSNLVAFDSNSHLHGQHFHQIYAGSKQGALSHLKSNPDIYSNASLDNPIEYGQIFGDSMAKVKFNNFNLLNKTFIHFMPLINKNVNIFFDAITIDNWNFRISSGIIFLMVYPDEKIIKIRSFKDIIFENDGYKLEVSRYGLDDDKPVWDRDHTANSIIGVVNGIYTND